MTDGTNYLSVTQIEERELDAPKKPTKRFEQALRAMAHAHPTIKAGMARIETLTTRMMHSAAHAVPQLIRPQARNLTVAITAGCNLRCIGCRYGRDFMRGKQLPWTVLKDLIDDAAAAGFWSIRLYGGEPLLHKDLPKVIAYAVDRGVKPYVTTNGILLGEKIDSLYSAGLRDITIGFYGTGPSYDAYVQRPDQFQWLEDSLRTVRDKYGSKVSLRLNWLLSRPTCNPNALRSAVDFAARYDAPIQVDLIHYSLPYFTEGPDRLLQFRPEDKLDIEEIVNQLLELKQQHPEILSQSEAGLRSIPEWLLKGPQMKVPCDRYQMIWVGADGTVQLCYVTFNLGNLHEFRLRDLLFTDEHKRAARSCFELDCPNCHCGYDSRVLKDRRSFRTYG